MSKPKLDLEKETDLQIWWRTTKEHHGKDVTSKVIGCGIYQNGFEYAKEIIAYSEGKEVSKYTFPLPDGEEIEYKQAA